jgi:hypothetical protein
MNKAIENCSPKFKKFFAWSCDFLKEHNKKLVIKNTKKIKYLEDGTYCSGWCTGEEIVVAAKHHMFQEVYCHEFCHMLQAIEKDPLWEQDNGKFWTNMVEGTLCIKDWDQAFGLIQLERDCERRTIQLSKKWDLFDTKKYAQKANLYLQYYQYVFLKKTWRSSTSIYKPNLVKVMPDKLLPLSKLQIIDMELMKLYEKEIGKK